MRRGATFRYKQLGLDKSEYQSAAKAIERLIKRGVIKRASTGVFYKPKETPFGELKPREAELLRPYLFENGKRIGYVTGTSLYNKMGLTTQIPRRIKIASKQKRISTNLGATPVKPVKSYAEVSSRNYYLLEILDALKDFGRIQDIDKESAIKLILERIKKLSRSDISRMVKLSLKYPPRAKALLGAILEQLGNQQEIVELKSSLNPLTEYRLGINESTLPTSMNWEIN